MHYWQNPFIEWQKEAPPNWDIYIFQTRPSRNKALICAVFEALSVLAPCQPAATLTGPLAGKKGTYRLSIAPEFREQVSQLTPQLGYTTQVYRLSPQHESPTNDNDIEEVALETIRWRKQEYVLRPVYLEPTQFMRDRAPDKRSFRLLKPNGDIVPVLGYRGDGQQLSRRGLPPEDARLMLNLARPFNHHHHQSTRIIDPFAGVGGIVYEAAESGLSVFSGDIDPKLRYGLSDLSQNRHTIQDSTALPFPDEAFTAVVSELPFDQYFLHDRAPQLTKELIRMTAADGRVVLMTGVDQAQLMKHHFTYRDTTLIFESQVNRKGTDVYICVWQKGKS